VDVGAFIGEASIAVADEASSIYAIEPSPRSYPCLEANAAQFDHITTANYAVWDKRDEIEFNLGSDPTEDSILDPDDTDETNSITVPADTIEQICNDLNVDTVDFLKIEAEGVEPEILDGIGQLQPTKIAVNCDPERDGQSPKLSVIEKLSNKGYSVFEGGGPSYTVVYGTLAQECK
jgi:FkbM family methyltransferase